MLLSIGMTQTLYMNIATLLPIEAGNLFFGDPISSGMIALIIAMFEIAYILSAPIIGLTLKKVGRKNYIVVGYLIIVVGTAGTAFLPLFLSKTTFIIVAIFFRFLQGYGDSCVATSVYSVVGIEFPK
jgi:MFS family permease